MLFSIAINHLAKYIVRNGVGWYREECYILYLGTNHYKSDGGPVWDNNKNIYICNKKIRKKYGSIFLREKYMKVNKKIILVK